MRRERTDNRKERMECPGFVRERRGKAALKRTDGFVRSSLHVTRYGKGSKKRKVNICVFCVVFNYEGRMQRFGSIAKVGSAHPGAVSKTRSAAAARNSDSSTGAAIYAKVPFPHGSEALPVTCPADLRRLIASNFLPLPPLRRRVQEEDTTGGGV